MTRYRTRIPWPAALSDSRPAVIVGSGPSLADFDFTQLDTPALNVIGINDQAWRNLEAYRCDWFIYQDEKVHRRYHNHALPEGVDVLGKVGKFRQFEPVWDMDRVWDWPGEIDRTNTTSTSAIQFAGYLGAKEVALLGIDCTTGYYWPTPAEGVKANATFLRSFDKLLRTQKIPHDPTVTQCSIGSPLAVFRKETFEDWSARVIANAPNA